MEQEKKEKISLSVLLEPELHEQIRETAFRLKVSQAEIVRQAVKEYLEKIRK